MAIKKTSITTKTQKKKTYRYTPAGAAKDAYQRYRELEASEPDYSSRIGKLAKDIAGRKKFSYNPTTDAAYQYYADRYRRQGKLAMQDTIGQATQLSGGYDNSYANVAGQQQYNAYLGELGDILPSLKEAALGVYTAEGDDLNNRLAALQAAQATRDGKIDAAYQRWATMQSAADAAAQAAKSGGSGRSGGGRSGGSGGGSGYTSKKWKGMTTAQIAAVVGPDLMQMRSDEYIGAGNDTPQYYNTVSDDLAEKMVISMVDSGMTKSQAKAVLKYMGLKK